MNYGSYLGCVASKDKSGLRQAENNPAQVGYSISKPLDRVRKQTLQNCANANYLNTPGATLSNQPDRVISTASLNGTFLDQANQFASDLWNESSGFLTGQVFTGVPNYWLVVAGVTALLLFKGGGRYHRR